MGTRAKKNRGFKLVRAHVKRVANAYAVLPVKTRLNAKKTTFV